MNNIKTDLIIPQTPKVIDVQKVMTYVPKTSYNNAGLAKFDSAHFLIDADGKVHIRKRAIRSVSDFTINPATGVGVIHYTDGTFITVNFPVHKELEYVQTDVVREVRVSFDDWLPIDNEYYIGYSAKELNLTNSNFLVTAESNTYLFPNDVTSSVAAYNVELADIYKADDGALLIKSPTRFAGRVLIVDPKTIVKITEDNLNITVDSELSDTSTNPVQNKVIKGALDGKVDEWVADYSKINSAYQVPNELITVLAQKGDGTYIPVYVGRYGDITKESIVVRNSAGQIVTASPTTDSACANKQYVDDLFNSMSDGGASALVIYDSSFPDGMSVDTARAIMTNFHYLDAPDNTCCIVRNGSNEVGVVLSRKYSEEGTATIQREITELCIAVGPKIYKYTHTLTRDLENDFAETVEVSAPTILDIENKLNKITTEGSVRAYGIKTSGEQTYHVLCTSDASSTGQSNTNLPQRIALFRDNTGGRTEISGHLVTGRPTQPYQAVPLIYAQENFSQKLYRHQIKLTKEDSEAKYMLDFTIINTSSTPLTTLENVADAISDGLVANEYHRPAYYEGIVPIAGKGLVSISRISSTISVYGCVIQSGTGPTELSFSINLPTEYGPGTTLLSIVDRPIEL